MTSEQWIYATTRFEGIHSWPECPYKEVAYLKSPHRHIFHIKVSMTVTHNNRECEFIMLKHRVSEWVTSLGKEGVGGVRELGPMSCEMIAGQLFNKLVEKYGEDRLYVIDVSEDGENGSIFFGNLRRSS